MPARAEWVERPQFHSPVLKRILSTVVLWTILLGSLRLWGAHAAVVIVSLIVNALAPTFGGRKDARRALQVTAYSFTPAWVAAALMILPALDVIASLLGLYGLFLLYTGLPVLMQSTRDRTLGYTVVIVICTVAITVAIAVVSGLLLGVLMPPDLAIPESGTADI